MNIGTMRSLALLSSRYVDSTLVFKDAVLLQGLLSTRLYIKGRPSVPN